MIAKFPKHLGSIKPIKKFSGNKTPAKLSLLHSLKNGRMRIHFTLILLLFIPVLAHAQKSPNQLTYDIVVKDIAKEGRMEVKMTLAPNGKAITVLDVPKVWGLNSNWSQLRDVTVKGGRMKVSSDSLQLIITHSPKKKIELDYTVVNCVKDSMADDREIYLPAIKASYMTAFTNSFLLAISDSVNPTTDCTIRFTSLPYDKLYCSFSAGNLAAKDRESSVTRQIRLMNVRNAEVQNGIFVAGDYRITEATSKTGQKVALAIRGKWAFSDSELYSLIDRTMNQERLFWDDFSSPNFLITFTPTLSDHPMSQSYSGTGLHKSFAVSCTNNDRATVASLSYLFYHELMHNWIGNTILNAADEELSYWFSEGFTDYFTRVNMLASGEIDEKGYYQLIDSVFRSYYADDRLTLHNDSIKVHFWDDSYIGKIPYNRGSLFAMYLDCQIRMATSNKASLKTVMQEMLTEAIAAGGKQFQRDWLQQEVRKQALLDITPWIDNHLISGQPITVEQYNQCLPRKLAEKQCKVFGFGFDYQKDENGDAKITVIRPETGASKADFKVGDIIRGYNVYMQPDSDSQVLVRRDGKDIWIDFHPYEWRMAPQFVE